MSSKRNPSPSSTGGLGTSDSNSSGTIKRRSLNEDYPVNSVMEIKIAPSNETVTGLVYCTDDISNSIVLKKSVNYTTLSSDIWVLNANSVLEARIIVKEAPMEMTMAMNSAENSDVASGDGVELAIPLLNVSKETIDKREKRAIMLAEDSFKHINQKASPQGQVVFDKLLKACNEVVWDGESITVLSQISVAPPYGSDNCRLLESAGGDVGLNEGSLERVKRIVGAV